jgi:hypothetical protein
LCARAFVDGFETLANLWRLSPFERGDLTPFLEALDFYHRATPGRIMRQFSNAPHTWLLSDLISGATDQPLDKDFLLSRQAWLESTIRRLAAELDDFWVRNYSLI